MSRRAVSRKNCRRRVTRPALQQSNPARLELLEDRRMLAFTVNHTPYLQLGNAALTGYDGGTDQAEIIWQTTGTQDTDTFTAQMRHTGDLAWTSVTLNPQLVTGVEGRINHSVTLPALAFNDNYDYLITHLRGGSPIATYQPPMCNTGRRTWPRALAVG
ncbi:MAG: hypothetical protein K2Y37_10515 [Pirellulales bacterium]|nr:hypothetical protein [Pirellulales bacterium]